MNNRTNSLYRDKCIVVVCGDPSSRNMVFSTLSHESQEGCRPVFLENGETALEWIRNNPHADLVILDGTTTESTGPETCGRIRERYSPTELPILLLVAHGDSDRVEAAYQAGANDFLTVPCESWELRARMGNLLQTNRMIEERIRKEISLLQAQIRPHFLFNTLNSIAALSKLQPEKTTALVTDFGHYLQESFRFDPDEPLVPFERELRLARSYLNIEKVRFAEWLTFEIKLITEEPFLIPPLTLQPLVENAVRHGIMRRANGGHVQIVVARDGEEIRIVVKDNGVGIDEDKLAALLNPSARSESTGLRSIERRLKKSIGRGLFITSNSERGTEVEIRLPIAKVGIHENDFD